jgi:hypothetical protein
LVEIACRENRLFGSFRRGDQTLEDRIDFYRVSVGIPDEPSVKEHYSAVFISWCMRVAGASNWEIAFTVWSSHADCVPWAYGTGRRQPVGYAERLIGSIRRECLDHIVVLSETHLRRILKYYARYYNEMRTHLSLNEDAPLWCAVQVGGRIVASPLLGGLHHQYCRI